MELTCDWITAEETIPRAVSAAKLQLDSLWGSHGEAPAIERGNVLRVYTARTDFDGLWWLQKVPVDPQRRTFQVPIRQIRLGGLRGEGLGAAGVSLTRESVAKPMCRDPDSSPDRPPFQRSGAVAPCRRAGTFRENHPAPNTLRHTTGLRCMIRFGNLAGAHRKSGSPRPPRLILLPVFLYL